ncbi:unnamed protein product [Moneuplotes crassus]|uniref:Uncharacterized protein n=1 Tax=Euplotes crassus TaxID=5936 RepID=A0AAD1Y077_EUPCR|nr:unnamed protein product [Moneuplotes crassus]
MWLYALLYKVKIIFIINNLQINYNQMKTRIATRNSKKAKGMAKTREILKGKSSPVKAKAVFKRKLSECSL